jgi:Tol biopolymer transport system component
VKGRLALAVVVVALLATAALAALVWSIGSSPVAAGPTPKGKVAFSAPPSDDSHLAMPSDLYVIDPDGSDRRRVARCSSGADVAPAKNLRFGCIVRGFAWSPDGRRLAFIRGNMGGATSLPDLSLFVVNLDGQRERRLQGCGKPKWPSCGDFFGSQPAWSPDSSRVVVPRGGSLYVFDVDRGVYRRLTPGCGRRRCFDMHPDWAPNGSRIVFARMGAPSSQSPPGQSLYSVKPDGSGLRRLTNRPGWAGNPVWSPDGRRIAFDEWGGSEDGTYVMGADGSDPTPVLSGPNSSGPHVPAWSPDGTQIAYITTPATGITVRARTLFIAEIWLMKANGSERRRLYRSGSGLETWGRPVWSPGGKYIAFGVGLTGDAENSGIYVVKADGTGLRRVAAAPTDAAWQPGP